jgi:hypothetical protein
MRPVNIHHMVASQHQPLDSLQKPGWSAVLLAPDDLLTLYLQLGEVRLRNQILWPFIIRFLRANTKVDMLLDCDFNSGL